MSPRLSTLARRDRNLRLQEATARPISLCPSLTTRSSPSSTDYGIAGKGGPKPKAPELKRAESARRDLQAMGDPARAKDLPLGTRIKLDQEMEELAELVAAWRKALRGQ